MKSNQISIAHYNVIPSTASHEFESKLLKVHPDLRINRTSDHEFEILHGDAMDKDNKSVVTSFTKSHYIKPASYKNIPMFYSKHLRESVCSYKVKVSHLEEGCTKHKYMQVKNALNESVAKEYALDHASNCGLKSAKVEGIYTA